jgi:hypothetical protein
LYTSEKVYRLENRFAEIQARWMSQYGSSFISGIHF